jgi:hypothetical protein
MNIRIAICVLAFSLLPARSAGLFGVTKDGRLDTKTISSAYNESEFEPVRVSVEKYLKQRGDAVTREEKIFAFKYLGVIYAADSSSRVRAESYFNRLLDLAPNIELIDMYVSPKIMEVFEGVKNERRRDEQYRSNFDAYGNPIKPVNKTPSRDTVQQPANTKAGPTTAKPELRKEESGHAWIWWTAGAAALGAGVGLYILTTEQGPTTDRTITAGK